MNDLSHTVSFAESLLDLIESKFAYIEWGTPNLIGHCYVYWDAEATAVLEEDESANKMVWVPQPRWLAGKCIQSRPLKCEEKRFDGLREALEWLTEPT